LNINGLPVAGNFDENAINGDEVGVFTGTNGHLWYFDTNHDYQLDTPLATPQLTGYPIVGDFDGDGHDDLGTWANDQFQFLLTDGTQRAWLSGTAVFQTINFGFIGARERPVAADMDQDGIDDIGLWVPDRSGQTPAEGAEWFFLVSNDPNEIRRIDGQVNTLEHAFEPIPFGKDTYVNFGDEFALPVVGNFDPPASVETPTRVLGGQTNQDNPHDVDRDTFVTPIDVLVLVNLINLAGSGVELPDPGVAIGLAPDVNSDGFVSSLDPLSIINYLNRPEGESSVASEPAPNAADDLDAAGKASTGSFVQFAAAAPIGDTAGLGGGSIDVLADAQAATDGSADVISPAASTAAGNDAIDEALAAWDDEGPLADADGLQDEQYDTDTWDDALGGLFD
jgi:hypothetical protein